MSKGNINYKYLRRRKNWFQRNWKALIIYIVLILAVLGAGAFVCIRFTPLGSKLGITQSNESKENKASPGADNNAQGDGSNKNSGQQPRTKSDMDRFKRAGTAEGSFLYRTGRSGISVSH